MDRLSEIANKYFLQSLKDEDFVMKLTKEKWGGIVRKALPKEDWYDHIDFFWKADDDSEEIGFDVKGLRKHNRSDKDFNDTITWIELTNVKGFKGSIYGKAKYLAFITNDSIIYIPREKIITFVEEKIKGKETVHTCPNECYIPYNRKNRKDLIVKVKIEDLKVFAKQVLNFNKEKKNND